MSTERVTLTQLFMGQQMQNVLNFNNPDGAVSPSAIATELKNNWIAQCKTLQAGSCVYTQIKVQRLDTPTVAPYVESVSIAGTASGWSQAMPFICLVYKLLTSTSGRHGRGRFFLGGINHGAIGTDGLWLAGTMTGFFQPVGTALQNRYKAVGGTGPITLVVMPPTGGVGDEHGVVTISARTTPGLQRRRSIGVGA